jgi:threonine/homoserine/homoserine lactone efflux protein
MSFSVWLTFAAASIVMGLIPGPGVTAIVGYALGSGRKTELASVAGMAVGNPIAMTLSLAGVGALLAASAFAFSLLKWLGATGNVVRQRRSKAPLAASATRLEML